MCLASAYWARISRIVYSNTRDDAAAIGFDDAFIYDEMPKVPADRAIPMEHQPTPEASTPFAAWMIKTDKITVLNRFSLSACFADGARTGGGLE